MLAAAESLSTATVGFPILTAIVLLPLLGALIVALLPKANVELVPIVGITVTAVTFALTVWMLGEFTVGEAGFQFVSDHPWVDAYGIGWKLGVDGISLWLVLLTGLLFPVALIGPNERHDLKAYTAWLLLLEAGVMGVFLSLDLIVFFVFFEIVLVPMYFLIGGWGHGKRTYAATKFFLYTMFGSATLLVASVTIAFLTRAEIGHLSFDVRELATAHLATNTARWLFLAFALAFAIKVPLFPLHTWLPDAHTEAPTAGSVILAGVMLKMGTYGLLRFGLYLFPEASVWFAPTMLTLGVIGIVYGALVAIVQKDLKRLVAYSSVAHLGFIVIGTYSLTRQGISGGVLQMVNHGLSTGALFLLVGWIYERRHTREIAKLKGIQGVAPVLAGVFMIVMLSSVGLPGLNGFVGEFMILTGTFLTARWWAVVAATGVVLAALYLLWAFQRSFNGVADDDNAKIVDLNLRERVAIAPLLVLIVFMGVYPKPFLDRIEPSVRALITHVEERTATSEPAVAKAEGRPQSEAESAESTEQEPVAGGGESSVTVPPLDTLPAMEEGK